MKKELRSLIEAQESKSAKVGVAIIGCGYWGVHYVRIFQELPDARVIAVCDQRPDRLREIARRFPGLSLTTQAEEAVSQPMWTQ